MTTAFNSYAAKAYSEHPVALWSFDDPVYYISLLSDENRYFSQWTLENCIADDTPTLPDSPSPFANSSIYSSIQASSGSEMIIKATSPELFTTLDIDISINTFCINFFLYQNPTYINWFRIGFEYTDLSSNPQTIFSNTILPPQSESWININKTFELPTAWQDEIKVFIEISLADSGVDVSSKIFIMNGISIGQNSETTCYESLGSTYAGLPDSTGLINTYGISSDQYGVLSDSAYYIVKNNALLANNSSVPIIYGTDNSTILYSAVGNTPSIIFPGKGMLNNSGRYNNYSLEFWMQLDAESTYAKRIIGPIDSNDGIYIKEGFISIVVGQEISSHFISEWYRPMLVHFIIKDSNISLLINGEEVAFINYDRESIELPEEKDWWGIYSYSEISLFKVDCISIYPYPMSSIAAKRRFAWGQATPSVQFVDTSFLGTPTTIDFSTSQYGPSILYPDIAKWNSGYFNNMIATKDSLSVPDYELPVISLDGRDIFEWYLDNLDVNNIVNQDPSSPKFFTFRPNIDENNQWDVFGNSWTEPSYLNFPSIGITNDPLSAIYAVFQIENDIEEKRTFLKFINSLTNDIFEIYVISDTVYYYINNTEVKSFQFLIGDTVFVGINFELVSTQFGYEISRFFSSPSAIQMYVGGDGENTFEGKIYRVGFCNQTNYQDVSDFFDTEGIADSQYFELMINHIASYTLTPEIDYSNFFLDISVSSSWEEYYPLSYFATYVKNENGELVYDLDFLQLNLGYPTVGTLDIWKYSELSEEFEGQDYQDLENSEYYNYYSLKTKNNTGGIIDTSQSSLQSFITFQDMQDGVSKPLSEFTFTKELPFNSVIYVDQENTIDNPLKAYDTKFVFKDNTIVYPPKELDFLDISMVVTFNISQRSILKNPLTIKSFEITSKTFNYDNNNPTVIQKTEVGTKFGSKVYPFVQDGASISYKENNPFSIYKTTTPYLYTTKNSGIALLESSDVYHTELKSINIPINQNKNENFNVSAFQFWVCYREVDQQPDEDIFLLEIKHKNGYFFVGGQKVLGDDNAIRLSAYGLVDFFLETIDGGNSSTSLFDNDIEGGSSVDVLDPLVIDGGRSILNQIDDNVIFYQNGRIVSNPILRKNEWSVIGMQMLNQLEFSQYEGAINLLGNAVFNNVSYYLSEGLGLQIANIERPWLDVLNFESVIRPWSFWSENSQTWRYVYILSSSSQSILSPEDIFDTYVGTNRFVVDDGLGVRIDDYDITSFTNVSWQTFTGKAV